VEDSDNPFLPISELKNRFSKVGWLVKGYIPKGAVGLLFGASGSFKTFIALDLGLHIANGINWLDVRTIQGPVFFIAGEGGASIVKRIEAWLKHKGISEFPKFFQVCPEPIKVDDQDDLDLLIDSLSDRTRSLGQSPALLVIDTLSQCSSGEEDSNTQMSNMLSNLISRIHGEFPDCVILFTHHPGHGNQKRMRGASALQANTDFVLYTEKNNKALRVRLDFVKLKDGEIPVPKEFELNKVELGIDEDGEAINSLVAVCSNKIFSGTARQSFGQYEKAIIKTLDGKGAILESDCRDTVIDKFVGEGTNRNSAIKGYRRAIEALIEEGILFNKDPYLEMAVTDDQE
jgi:hypothetical protein